MDTAQAPNLASSNRVSVVIGLVLSRPSTFASIAARGFGLLGCLYAAEECSRFAGVHLLGLVIRTVGFVNLAALARSIFLTVVSGIPVENAISAGRLPDARSLAMRWASFSVVSLACATRALSACGPSGTDCTWP